MWTAGETLGFALGPGLVLVVLALTGFVSSKADEQVTQPDSAITGVLMAFTAVPAILVRSASLSHPPARRRVLRQDPAPPSPSEGNPS